MTTELGLAQMSWSELLAFTGIVVTAVIAAACFCTFIEIAWKQVFKR